MSSIRNSDQPGHRVGVAVFHERQDRPSLQAKRGGLSRDVGVVETQPPDLFQQVSIARIVEPGGIGDQEGQRA